MRLLSFSDNQTVQKSNAIVICNCCRAKLDDETEQILLNRGHNYDDLSMPEIGKGGLHTWYTFTFSLHIVVTVGKRCLRLRQDLVIFFYSVFNKKICTNNGFI